MELVGASAGSWPKMSDAGNWIVLSDRRRGGGHSESRGLNSFISEIFSWIRVRLVARPSFLVS